MTCSDTVVKSSPSMSPSACSGDNDMMLGATKPGEQGVAVEVCHEVRRRWPRPWRATRHA